MDQSVDELNKDYTDHKINCQFTNKYNLLLIENS